MEAEIYLTESGAKLRLSYIEWNHHYIAGQLERDFQNYARQTHSPEALKAFITSYCAQVGVRCDVRIITPAFQ